MNTIFEDKTFERQNEEKFKVFGMNFSVQKAWLAFRVFLTLGFVIVQIWFVTDSLNLKVDDDFGNLKFDTHGKPMYDKMLEATASINAYFLST